MVRKRGGMPAIFRHQTGQLAAKVQGRMVYLGKDPEMAKVRLAQIILEGSRVRPAKDPMLLSELCARYVQFAERHYGDGLNGAKEVTNIHALARLLVETFPLLAVQDFGPRRLELIRGIGLERGWSRRYANRQTTAIRRIFAWAVERELLPVGVYQALKVLSPLRFGKGDAKEGGPRLPVPEEDFRAVLPHLLPPARALVELIMATGLRVGEACQMRMEDLDRSGHPWVYTLKAHKTVVTVGHRKVYLGPEAQRILLPFLRLNARYLFRPRDAVAARHARDRARRATPVQPSQVDRSKINPLRSPGECYGAGELRKSVHRACRRAGIPEWCPARLRHNAADRLARAYNAEVARLVLGHTKLTTTAIYLSRDEELAKAAAMKIG